MANDKEDKEDPVERVGHIVADECKEIDPIKYTYTTHIDMDRATNQVSPTLQRILENVSPFFCNSLFTAFIGDIVTGVVQNKSTQIQLALGILYRHFKIILNHLHK